jgi:hypothetical protein
MQTQFAGKTIKTKPTFTPSFDVAAPSPAKTSKRTQDFNPWLDVSAPSLAEVSKRSHFV